MAFNPNEHLGKVSGRDYLEVKWRLVWFRDVLPGGGIHTEIVNADPVIVKATVISPDGMVLATAHGSADDGGKNVVWKGRAIEKAETAAIGRALAHAGFGTQFTEDDEAGVVDSPVQRPQQPQQPRTQPAPQQNAGSPIAAWAAWIASNPAEAGKPFKSAIGVLYTIALAHLYDNNTHHMKASIAKAEQAGVLKPDMTIAQALSALATRNESAA